MIKIIFHLADLHIRNLQNHDQYRRILKTMMEEFKEKANGLEHDEIRIVIAGDLFHQKITVSNEQILFASWLLNQLSAIGKVIVIPGNHDFLESNHGRLDSITPVVELLNNANVLYYREFGVYEDNNVNWVVYSLYNENVPPKFTRMEAKKYIGIFHGAIKGCKTEMGYDFEQGYDQSIFEGCDIVLCGDIHKRQVLQYGNTRIFMVGSTIQNNFGETVKQHGYGVYFLEKNAYTFHDLKNDTPYLKFQISDIEDIMNGRELLLNLD